MFKPATSSAQHYSRTPITVAGAALLGLSLLLTAAPALGAANHGDNSAPGGGNGSGNVKVHDAASGVETNGSDNEPHVCTFWLEFDFADTFEAGTWFIVSWAPTGDGSTVESGTYDTAGDGTDQSDVILLTAGHYRVEWAATGESTTKKKTFWVDARCGEPASPAEESPVDDPAPPADESPVEENVPPSDDPAPPADEQPPASGDESGAEEPAPPAEEQVLADESGAEDPAPPSGETVTEDPAPPSGETVTEDPAPPSDEAEAPPSDEESAPQDAAQGDDPGSTDEGTPPNQGQLGGSGNTDGPTMADTSVATLPAQTGLLGTIGLLLLILVHATARRELRAERE
jgi:hypothetical protein